MQYITKNDARNEMKRYRNNLDREDIANLSDGICNNLLDCGCIDNNVRYILSFASYRSEPDTSLIDIAIRDRFSDIKLAYPKVMPIDRHGERRNICEDMTRPDIQVDNVKQEDMEFYIVNSYEELRDGYMNIPEPDDGSAELLTVDKINSMSEQVRIIVPGLAFDMSGMRAGYGGGFYDRYLGRLGKVKKIGICFDRQLMRDKRLACDEHDIGVDMVVTEKAAVDTNPSNNIDVTIHSSPRP